MKRFYRKPWFWLLGLALFTIGASAAALAVLNPNHLAQTKPEHPEPQLRTRRYKLRGDVVSMQKEIVEIIKGLRTYGQSWRYVTSIFEAHHSGILPNGKTLIRAEVPVVVFTDDLQIELKKEAETVVVNVRSESRTGDSDLGENRRHLLQILERLDTNFEPETN